MNEGRAKVNDLKRRLRDIEGYAPPDLWKEITSSGPRAPRAEPGPARRPLVVAFAFAIALAGVILVARAFGGREPQPTSEPPLTTGPVTARVAYRIDVGPATTVAYGAGSVWVSVDPVDSSDRSLLRIDPATDEIVATIPLPGVPGWETGGGGLVVAEGSVWVAGGLDGAGSGGEGFITRIDPATNRVIDTITLKEGDVADVAVNGEAIWALIRGNPSQPKIVRIDPSSGQAVATIPLDGGYGRSIFAIDGSVLAAIAQPPGGPFDGGTLVRIDPSTNQVAGTLDLGTYPSVATGDGTMWAVTDSGLVQIDLGTGQPTGAPANVPCTGDALAAGAGGVWCFDPARDRALTRFNPQTAQVDVAMRPDDGTGGTALTISPGSIWVVNGEELTRVVLTTVDPLTVVQPYPESIYESWDSATDVIEQRVRDWYVAVNVTSMSVEAIQAGIDVITSAIANRPDNPEGQLLWLRELVLRREALCHSLPADHAYRAGEYCSPTSAPGFTIATG